jgi:hypothetical protein
MLLKRVMKDIEFFSKTDDNSYYFYEPDKTNINKIGIVITPTSGNTTSIGADGLRINDEDTFDPYYGLISRSVLTGADILTKVPGRQVDIEYKLALEF